MSENEGKENVFERITPVLLFGVVLLAFAVGILWQKVSTLEGGKGEDVSGIVDEGEYPTDGKLTEDQAAQIPSITEDDHVKGSRDAKVFLIEYSDLECPFCASFHPTAEQILEEYGDDVGLVYRHFPLDTLHPMARPAAVASECAADVGGNEGFWNFIAEIFGNQEENLTDESFEAVAINVGLDASAFLNCVEEGKYSDRVENDYQGGLAAGVNGTPANFIINGNGEAWLVPGAVPFEVLKPTIDEALGN